MFYVSTSAGTADIYAIIHFVSHTKWLLTFTERYVCYYCLLAANHGNYTRGLLKNFFIFFIYLVCEAIGTAATSGLLCQPRVIVKMIVEKQMECRLARETNRSSRRKPAPAPLLSITKSHMTRPGFEPGPPRWEASD
jgi:hypothetical protein